MLYKTPPLILWVWTIFFLTDPHVVPDRQGASQVNTINSDTTTGHWYITLNIGCQEISVKIDTGDQVNLLSKNLHNLLKPCPVIKDTSINLSPYNSSPTNLLGECIIPIYYKEKNITSCS